MNYDDVELTKEQIHEFAETPEQNDYILWASNNWLDYCEFIRELAKLENRNNRIFYTFYLPSGGRDLITEKELKNYE